MTFTGLTGDGDIANVIGCLKADPKSPDRRPRTRYGP